MTKALIVAAAAALTAAGMANEYSIDAAHSSVGFKVRHLGIASVNGSFSDYTAKATVDPADLSTLQAEAVIQVGSIDTGIERRDNHLRSDDFFNAEAYPTMTFVSREVRNVDGNELQLVGDLTIRDITRELVLDVEYLGSATMRGTQVLGFEARGEINRFDYNLKWDAVTEAGGLIVGENVRLILELEATAN